MTNGSTKPIIFLAFANDRDDRVRDRYLRNLPEEARRLQGALETAEREELCEVVVKQNATIDDILNVFQQRNYRNRIAIFHYGGHANSYQLLFETPDGKPAAADAAGLANFLRQQTGLQLVFLNGCSTRQQARGLLGAGVSAVIATSQAIDDEVATDFSVRFYQALAGGAAIGTAFKEAEAAVQTARGGLTRNLYAVADEEELLVDGSPWNLYQREGAEEATDWNLPDAADNPLFGLPPLPELDLPASPYRHLNWYRREDAEVFFGRGREIRDLYEGVTAPRTAPILLFYGQSGVGKSSLLAAGLLPRLERDYAIRYMRRDQALGLLGSLAEALDAGDPGDLASAWRATEQREGKPLVVVLDQVEEVYTRPNEGMPDELAIFLDGLRVLLGLPEERPQGKLILGFRKEWLAELEKEMAERKLPRTKVFLQRLGKRGIREVVTGPSRSERLRGQYGLVVAEDLPVEIADDLLADRGSAVAPTLAILLSKMWERARERDYDRPTFDGELYDQLRSEGLGLGDFLDQQLDALRADQPETVESGLALDLLAHHTTPLGTAEQRVMADLEETYRHQQTGLPMLVQECQDMYLLVDPARNQPDRPAASRLAHDTLAPVVRQRFDESDRPGQRARRILESRAVEWEEEREGAALDEADLTVVEQGAPGMRVWTHAEERLIRASRRERDRRRRNRLIWQGVGILALLLILVAASVAVWQWRTADARRQEAEVAEQTALDEAENARLAEATAEARKIEAEEAQAEAEQQALISRAQELAARSQIALAQFPPRALLLAAEAVSITLASNVPSLSVAEQAMLDAVSTSGGMPLTGHASDVSALAFSHDDRWLVTAGDDRIAGDDNIALLWDMENLSAEPTVLRGHEGSITAVAFSHDDRWLATAGDDGIARMWNVDNATAEPAVLGGHEDRIKSVAFSHDDRWLATAGDDGTARLWEVGNPGAGPIALRSQEDHLSAIVFSDDDRWMAATCGGNACLWSLEPPSAEGFFLEHGSWVETIGFSRDSLQLMTASYDGSIQKWELGDPAAGPIILQGGSPVLGATFSHSGTRLAIASSAIVRKDGIAILRNVDDQSTWSDTLSGHEGWIHAIAFSHDDRWLATAGADHTARVWDLQRSGTEPVILRGHEDEVDTVVFSHDGRWLATASDDGTARLWDLQAPSAMPTVPSGHDKGAKAVLFSHDDGWLVAWGDDGTARLWRVDNLSAEPVILSHEGGISAAACSHDDRWLATGGPDFALLWEVSDLSAEPVVLDARGASISSLAFSRDGRWLAAGGGDQLARIWDLQTPGAQPTVFEGHEGGVYRVAFSNDSRRLATASTGDTVATVRLWDVANPGTEPVVLHGLQESPFSNATFSPDDRWLASSIKDGSVRLWDLQRPNGDPVTLQGRGPSGLSGHIAFSHDSRWLTCGSVDGTTRLWDLWDLMAEPAVLRGHESWIESVTFSHDNRWLATASEDGTIRLWDVQNPGIEALVLRGQASQSYDMAFSHDDQWLATVNHDGSVHVWARSPKRLIEEACPTSGRNFTWEEWQRYFPGQEYRRTCPDLPVHSNVTAAQEGGD
jgi:WD40 repeat protein